MLLCLYAPTIRFKYRAPRSNPLQQLRRYDAKRYILLGERNLQDFPFPPTLEQIQFYEIQSARYRRRPPRVSNETSPNRLVKGTTKLTCPSFVRLCEPAAKTTINSLRAVISEFYRGNIRPCLTAPRTKSSTFVSDLIGVKLLTRSPCPTEQKVCGRSFSMLAGKETFSDLNGVLSTREFLLMKSARFREQKKDPTSIGARSVGRCCESRHPRVVSSDLSRLSTFYEIGHVPSFTHIRSIFP